MRSIYFMLSFAIVLMINHTLKGQESFEIFIDSQEDCFLQHANSDDQGNIILVGGIGGFNFDYDAFIMKVYPNGEFITNRFDLGDTVSIFSTIDILDNGNYFVTGCYNTETVQSNRDHLWVAILDEDLNLVDQKSYLIREPYVGFAANAYSIIDNEGNVVVTTSGINPDSEAKVQFTDFAFYKFNQNGDTLLSRYYSFIHDEFPLNLTKMPGSDNLMLIERCTVYNNNVELMQLDPQLNIISTHRLGGPFDRLQGSPSSDYWVSDTELLVSGQRNWDTGSKDELAIGVQRVDTSGIMLQELLLDKPDTTEYPAWRNSMACANDSTIYIGGFQSYGELWSTTPAIAYLYMIDKDMNLVGYKELGGKYYQQVIGIIATHDDGCLVYALRFSTTEYERDIQIWKVSRDDMSIITQVTDSKDQEMEIMIYPNPASDRVFIQLPQSIPWTGLSLSIYNLEGKKVFQKLITQPGNLLEAKITNLKPGYYIVSIDNNNQNIFTTKILKR
ncbi:MAG: T9SS type A sorting domain-containing protein [Bacteroidales bacterium]|nr:T9SS type A sorting domain-containing protein [Bacteroidales bacterium]MDD3527024.1 T9SS type A sorting domain-containing protein [Bacteroidales bacterium]